MASASFESHFATCSGFPTVADRPIFWTVLPMNDSSLEIPTDNCQPLSPSAISCNSSITTACTSRSNSLSLEPVNIIWNVSGVVIITFGGLRTCLFLSDWLVSP